MSQGRSENIDSLIEQVVGEVATCVRHTPSENLAQAGTLIEAAPRIFITGAGRTGLCMRALAMRLMHVGKTVYVVGETTTPSIAASDLLLLGSGSGQTTSLLAIAGQARRMGVKILLFTTDGSSPLADLSDHLVVIPAEHKAGSKGQGTMSAQPMANLFEQSLYILSDSLAMWLMQRMGVDVTDMSKRHANLE